MVGNTSISIGSASELVEDTTPREHSPGTLGFALACESDGIKLPWDFIAGSDDPAPGMIPIQYDETGAAVGRELVRFFEQAEPPGAPPRCQDCAFRLGTPANTSLGTMANVLKHVMEGTPFYCHHGQENGEPRLLCRGWIALAPAEVVEEIAQAIATQREEVSR